MNNKLQPTSHERPRFAKATQGERVTGYGSRKNAASALIIAVILTSLLAIIGVMFVMIARVDKMATSAISENKELNFAVEAVVAKISQELALDVPRTDSNGLKLSEYYDYPGEEDKWLANLEPYQSGSNYYWRRISDIYNRLDANDMQAEIIADYQQSIAEDVNADADGDGVADSKWVELDNITSNKGKPIYAAIRIVDNGGMLNVNTAYKFDPNVGPADANLIDGSSQMQINLAALSQRGANGTLAEAADRLHVERCGAEPIDLLQYERNVVWRYNKPNGVYTPFDISDELELRNRFLLNQQDTYARIEQIDWTRAFLTSTTLDVPRYKPRHNINDPNDWFWKTNNSSWDVNEYDYRHIATTYNMDRIIKPNGKKMVNINRVDEPNYLTDVNQAIYESGIDSAVAAQIAVNLKDYIDSDSNVTPFIDANGIPYYGFERPCIYISELAWRIAIPPDANRSYAIELYKPYSDDNDPDSNWKIYITSPSSSANISWSGSKQFHVIEWQSTNTSVPLPPVDPNSSSQLSISSPGQIIFDAGSTISLTRDVNGSDVVVDSVVVPSGWLIADGNAHSIQRDITLHKCIRRLWASVAEANSPTLGIINGYLSSDSNMIQAHPANAPFTNVGEIGMVFVKSAYSEDPNAIGSTDTEATVRIDFTKPEFQQLFKYLTVFDPNSDTIDNDGDGLIDALDTNTPEYKVAGRININTAPWYVLAQLPWVSQRIGGTDYSLAQAIASYRDTVKGFKSIGELIGVTGMDYYKDGNDLTGFPDLTPGDGAANDFEERDVIFARISNLVTVRSDVFTVYILVRIGTDGPQKRVIAILDRSNVYSPTDKVRVIALHPVPDPR